MCGIFFFIICKVSRPSSKLRELRDNQKVLQTWNVSKHNLNFLLCSKTFWFAGDFGNISQVTFIEGILEGLVQHRQRNKKKTIKWE